MEKMIYFRGVPFYAPDRFAFGYLIIDDTNTHRICKEYDGEMFSEIVKPDTVGQFTKLYDATGYTIYEDDIIEYVESYTVTGGEIKIQGVVKMDIKGYWCLSINDRKIPFYEMEGLYESTRRLSRVKKVGNIHIDKL